MSKRKRASIMASLLDPGHEYEKYRRNVEAARTSRAGLPADTAIKVGSWVSHSALNRNKLKNPLSSFFSSGLNLFGTGSLARGLTAGSGADLGRSEGSSRSLKTYTPVDRCHASVASRRRTLQ